MKKIPLNKGFFALIDDSDFEKVSKFKWHVKTGRKTFYAATHMKLDSGKWATVRMHRFLLNLTDVKILCDHKNMDGLDNRKENLRVCTTAENSRNQGIRKSNTTGFKGVTFDKRDKKFKAEIRTDGKLKNLGLYDCPIMAAKAYDTAATKMHGEFAFLNFKT